jgi:hypothetical protein
VGRQVLDNLESPCNLDTLAARLAHLPGFDAEKEVKALQQKGLVFQEGTLFLSLVLPGTAQAAARFECLGTVASAPARDNEGAVPELRRLRRDDFRLRRAGKCPHTCEQTSSSNRVSDSESCEEKKN